jgi:oligoendopeptidase F
MLGAGGVDQQIFDSEMSEERTMQAFGSGTVEEFLMQYRTDVDNLKQLWTIDENKYFDFAKALKRSEGAGWVRFPHPPATPFPKR